MEQLSVSFSEKLDMPLAELCNSSKLQPSARVPVVVRCDRNAIPSLVDELVSLGGTVRHELAFIGAIAVWLPLISVHTVAKNPAVQLLELERAFTNASYAE